MFRNCKRNLIFVLIIGLLAFFGVGGAILWQRYHDPIENLTVIEEDAVEIPLKGGKPRFYQDIELEFPGRSMRSKVNLTLIDAVPASDTLVSEKGWRIPTLFGGRTLSIPVSVKKQKGIKILEFQLNGLQQQRFSQHNEDKRLVFGYETQSSIEWPKKLVAACYTYSPKEIDLGRPTQVVLTLDIKKVSDRVKDPGLAFFMRRDLPEVDVEVMAVPTGMLNLSSSSAYLFLGGLCSNIKRSFLFKVTARKQGTVDFERAMIIGGYLDQPIYSSLKVEGAKKVKKTSKSTISYLGDVCFTVKDRHKAP